MKKNVAVIYGGPSSERPISILSGRFAASQIDRDRYNVYEVLFNPDCWQVVSWDEDNMTVLGVVDKGNFSFEGVKFDVACIMIHGIPGENGLLQGYFEMMDVPVTTCSSFVCTIAFNKYSCKRLLADTGVKMADDIFLRRGESWDVDAIVKKLGLPVFVKPSDGGSSFGVTKVKDPSQMNAAIEYAFSEGDTILIEKAITGRELTQAIYMDSGQSEERGTLPRPYFKGDGRRNHLLDQEDIRPPGRQGPDPNRLYRGRRGRLFPGNQRHSRYDQDESGAQDGPHFGPLYAGVFQRPDRHRPG